jgi:hypothetical protein
MYLKAYGSFDKKGKRNINMNLVRIRSGLRSQMFQYALYLMLNTQTSTFPYAEDDPSALERYLGILHKASDRLNNKYKIVRRYLKSLYKNVVGSNSTFGWLAAHFGEQSNRIIIATSKWTNQGTGYDVCDTSSISPGEWIKI